MDETNARDAQSATRLFWLLLALHALAWTALPALSQPNPSLDMVEMTTWGHEWQWGYYKHPPLPAWLCAASVHLFGASDWPLLLVCQACVAICFWAAWRLANDLMPPWPALAAAALLQTCHYFNYSALDLNNNSPSKAAWALCVLSFYWAVTRGALWHWIMLGLSAAAALLTKYDVALLLASMGALVVLHPMARPRLRTAGPYLAALVAVIATLPHWVWLVQHDFLPIEYVRSRSTSNAHLLNHLVNPLRFALAQALALSVLLLLCIPLLGRRWRLRSGDAAFDFRRAFLIAVVLGPPVIATIASAVTGARLRSGWGHPMFTYAGVLLLFAFQHAASRLTYRRVALTSCGLGVATAVALVAINLSGPHLRSRCARIHYPGKQLSAEVHRRWGEVTNDPLKIVAGPGWWEPGNVAFYSKGQRPAVYLNLTPEHAPWTSDEEFNRLGGVILWTEGETPDAALAWQQRFPRLKWCKPIKLQHQSAADVPPAVIQMAIVPAESGWAPQYVANRDDSWLE